MIVVYSFHEQPASMEIFDLAAVVYFIQAFVCRKITKTYKIIWDSVWKRLGPSPLNSHSASLQDFFFPTM